ncbi:MAG: hypothetical protein JO209_05965 [Acidisphaera sp.]|nr:hypothetical protein [Acidisphaera sp.]
MADEFHRIRRLPPHVFAEADVFAEASAAKSRAHAGRRDVIELLVRSRGRPKAAA